MEFHSLTVIDTEIALLSRRLGSVGLIEQRNIQKKLDNLYKQREQLAATDSLDTCVVTD